MKPDPTPENQEIQEIIDKHEAANADSDEALLKRLQEIEAEIEAEGKPTGSGGAWVVSIGSLLAIGATLMVGNLSSPPPQTVNLEQPPVAVPVNEPPEEPIGHIEEQYQAALQRAIAENQKILNDLGCATTVAFKQDAHLAVGRDRISEQAAIAQKLNFTISMLERAIAQQGFFNGTAESRGMLRAPILDSQAALMALAGYGNKGEDCEILAVRYLEALEHLSYWLNRREAQRAEWQMRQPTAPPPQPLPGVEVQHRGE